MIAELSAATERAGLRFGLYYSLLDWSHPAYPDPDAYVDAYMRPQIRELVERFAPTILWGDGHWGNPPFVLALGRDRLRVLRRDRAASVSKGW